MATITGWEYIDYNYGGKTVKLPIGILDEDVVAGNSLRGVLDTSMAGVRFPAPVTFGTEENRIALPLSTDKQYVAYRVSESEYNIHFTDEQTDRSFYPISITNNTLEYVMILSPLLKGTNGVYTLSNSTLLLGNYVKFGDGHTVNIIKEASSEDNGVVEVPDITLRYFSSTLPFPWISVNTDTIRIATGVANSGGGGGGGGGGDDPYNQGGTSGTGGGGGNFSDQSDNIGFSGVPDYDITESGFVKAFAPSSAQLKELATYMWNTLDLDNWRKIFADPMDVITSLMMLPVTPNKGSVAEVTVGNISTGISMTTLRGQIVQIDCGTLTIKEYWGSYLDYDPYTKIQIFLPYIGFRPLKSDEVMGKTIHVKYNVDCLSGNCVAQILCGEDLLYDFAGSMGYQVPFSATDWSNFVSSSLTLAGAAITTVATGGASAPMTAPAIATSAVNMFKQNVDHSGTLAGNSGYLSDNYVYLTITRPRQALPKDQNKYSGYPSLVTAKLSDVTGYTVVKEVHLENISCTGAELNEMENLLKQGVIL